MPVLHIDPDLSMSLEDGDVGVVGNGISNSLFLSSLLFSFIMIQMKMDWSTSRDHVMLA